MEAPDSADHLQRGHAYYPLVKVYGNTHTPMSVDSADGDLQVVRIKAEPIQQLTQPPPQHVMAQKALIVKLLSEAAVLPKKNTINLAGYDMSSAVDAVVSANDKAIVPTDIAVAIPEGTYSQIAPRSGLAAKHHLAVGAGVIDADYRGNVRVVLFNHGNLDFHVSKGDRIAQLLLERIAPTPTPHHQWWQSNRCLKQFVEFNGLVPLD